MLTLTNSWRHTLVSILAHGTEVSPRGKRTKEIPQHTTVVDMRFPVMTLKERKLQYRFMAAEAFWILSGDNRVDGIAPWNSKIAEFSDDGQTFYGAYGPSIATQLSFVVQKLFEDRDTRQAVLTTWKPNPPATKDVPCTIAFNFQIRNGHLNAHVFMRSSDAWLGLPYDAFNFSMLATLICARLNQFYDHDRKVKPGQLFLTAASCHLYEPNWEAAEECAGVVSGSPDQMPVPSEFYLSNSGQGLLMDTLAKLRNSSPGDAIRWWEMR